VETDELRIAVAETYDVIVTLPEARAYTLFAETNDRSGYARGTLAPREGMTAPIPERRRRPMLTMADMGMMHDGGHGTAEPMHGHAAHAAPHAAHPPDPARAGSHAEGALPTVSLPDRVSHGPDGHGPASITMAVAAYRRLGEPGAGLGGDGWRVLTYGQLRRLDTSERRRPPTREFDLHLTGNMREFIWGFDGRKWSESDVIRFRYGERLRINMINDTMMSHPIHLHGMFMDLYAQAEDYDANPRKHTVNVQPAELLTVDVTADEPGQWAFHCHLLYHMEAGMFRTVAVVRSLDEGPLPAKA
jgi:CopA family copper-resistance protein